MRCVGDTDESGIGVSALGRSGNGIRGGAGRLSVPPLLSTGRKGRGTAGTRALSAAITRRNSATAAASPMVTKPPAIATAPATSSADPKVVSRIGTPKPTTNTPHAVERRPRIRMKLNIPLCHPPAPAARNSIRAFRKATCRPEHLQNQIVPLLAICYHPRRGHNHVTFVSCGGIGRDTARPAGGSHLPVLARRFKGTAGCRCGRHSLTRQY
jgi:hypothetical protein